jgi:tRNA A37 methylthiotransferase MiaB
MPSLSLLQLPVPPPSAFASTGNVPLAAGSLAVSTEVHSLNKDFSLETNVIQPEITDSEGDEMLIQRIIKVDPDFLGLSLYLWNSERSLYIADQVKKRNPKTKIFLGGPEVSQDNLSLLETANFDYAIEGEAESIFAHLLKSLLKSEPIDNIPNLFYRNPKGKLLKSLVKKDIDFDLNLFPSPYIAGYIPVEQSRSTYLETVRGCKSQCTYCFYPKSSNVLRSIDIEESMKLIQKLKVLGAKELVFLDPTFNHRPQFERFLDALIDVNYDGQLKMFAELRSEGITSQIAKKLAKAGFYKIELGMQSINKETLKRVKRFGSPEKVVEASQKLTDVGIELLLDLIIGLPGDKPEDIDKGIEFFKKYKLEEWVQTFILSVLPGTELRRDSLQNNITFMPFPPYRVLKTEHFSEIELHNSLFRAEEKLGRRLDEYPRILLCEANENSNDVLEINTDIRPNSTPQEIYSPGARHFSLRIRGSYLFNKKEYIFKLFKQKIKVDPYCTLDIVFCPTNIFPLDLIEESIKILNSISNSYLSRVQSHRNENYQRRVSVLLDESNVFPLPWITELNSIVPVFKDMKTSFVTKNIKFLGFELPRARIIERSVTFTDWKKLQKADPESIVFLDRSLEKRWNSEVLLYGE